MLKGISVMKEYHTKFASNLLTTGMFMLLAFSLLTTIMALRNNNLTMIRLRQAVFDADVKNYQVEDSVDNLRAYVYSHMNTNINSGSAVKQPIQLVNSYARAQAAEKDRVTKATAELLPNATSYCNQQFNSGLINNKSACIDQYSVANQPHEQPIDLEFYTFNFVSPSWSPDLAGWSIVASMLIAALIALRIMSALYIKYKRSNI